MQNIHQIKIIDTANNLVIPATVANNLFTLSSQCVGIAAIANQSLADGECTIETVQHIANIAENIQHDLHALASAVMDAEK